MHVTIVARNIHKKSVRIFNVLNMGHWAQMVRSNKALAQGHGL
jgi:hypothetical protein